LEEYKNTLEAKIELLKNELESKKDELGSLKRDREGRDKRFTVEIERLESELGLREEENEKLRASATEELGSLRGTLELKRNEIGNLVSERDRLRAVCERAREQKEQLETQLDDLCIVHVRPSFHLICFRVQIVKLKISKPN